MIAMRRLMPCSLSAANTASVAIATGMSKPATLRMRCFRLSPHSALPPHTESAEMPRMKALGLASMTLATAGSRAASISRIDSSKSSLLRICRSGMTMRPRWLVTPGGRMSSYSGWTTVLVEGVVTPKAMRQAR